MASKAPTTIREYRKWKAIHLAAQAGVFVFPVIPAAIVTGINWNDWFANAGPSLPLGFITLVASVVMGVVGMIKKKELFGGAVTGVLYVALLFACVGMSFKFLASLCNEIANMVLYIAAGILCAAVGDQADKTLVEPMVEEYKGLIEANCLDTKSKARKRRKEIAQADAKAMADDGTRA